MEEETRELDFKDWTDLLTKVMYIKSEEEVIVLNEEKIKVLRADDVCPSCGRKVRKNMSFCPDCGARLVKLEAENAANEPAEDAVNEPAKDAVNEPANELADIQLQSSVSEPADDEENKPEE